MVIGHNALGSDEPDFHQQVGSLSDEDRLVFYECLAHLLTVAIRGVWSDDRLTDLEKVTQIKWMNEIQHRVTAKIPAIRRKTHEWSEEDFGSMVDGYISEHPAIGPSVQDELWRCYGYVSNKK